MLILATSCSRQAFDGDTRRLFCHLSVNLFVYFFFNFYFLSPLPWVEKVSSRTGYKNKQYETRSYFPELVTYINLLVNSKTRRDMERQELTS